MKPEFNEKQQFRQWWFWLLLSPIVVIAIIVIIKQLILGESFGVMPMSDIDVYLLMLVVIAIIGLMLYLKLETTINAKGIFMSYRPFLKRNCNWEDIERVEVIDYGFVGYGFRISFRHGWIYNVRGNKGLKIHLRSGKHFTIGTQKPEALQEVLDRYYSSATS